MYLPMPLYSPFCHSPSQIYPLVYTIRPTPSNLSFRKPPLYQNSPNFLQKPVPDLVPFTKSPSYYDVPVHDYFPKPSGASFFHLPSQLYPFRSLQSLPCPSAWPSKTCPSQYIPWLVIILPSPCGIPSQKQPVKIDPSGKNILPSPCGLPSRNSPLQKVPQLSRASSLPKVPRSQMPLQRTSPNLRSTAATAASSVGSEYLYCGSFLVDFRLYYVVRMLSYSAGPISAQHFCPIMNLILSFQLLAHFSTGKPFPHDSTNKISKGTTIIIVNCNGGLLSQQSLVYLSAMMSYVSPKRISITNIRNTSKNKQLGSPSKPAIKEQEPNVNFLNLPPLDLNLTPTKNLQRLPSSDSHRESAMKSQNGSDKDKKAKTVMLQYFEEFMRDLRPQIGESDNVKISTTIKNISSGIQDFTSFTQQFFKIYNYAFALSLQREQNKQLVLPLKYKQAKKILLMEQAPATDQKSSRNRRLIELTKQNEDLKKEVFRCKESIKDLQKRLVFLIDQFKSRKTVYLKEIQKLISIIETSIKGIPDLITLLNSAKNVADNQLPLPNADLKLIKKESEYNTLFYNYNSSDPAIEAPSIQRYKSEGKLRINQ